MGVKKLEFPPGISQWEKEKAEAPASQKKTSLLERDFIQF